MTLCSGDKIMVYEENKEKCCHVEDVTEKYVVYTPSNISFEKDNITKMVVQEMQNVKHISYEKAIKILEILMDVDSEE